MNEPRKAIRQGSLVDQMNQVQSDVTRHVGRVKSSLHNLQAATVDWSEAKISDGEMKRLFVKLLGEAQDELDLITG